MNYPAPIALFAYNRLWHVQKTVEALQKNELAAQSELYIFSDGPRSDTDMEKVQSVREYFKSVEGFKGVTVIEREKNLGLAGSIIVGVTEIVSRFGGIIVLEDDMVTSPYFLRFMNEALELYRNDERVISIHGYMFPVKAELPETFFLKDPGCWGWATWERGWRLFEQDGQKLLNELITKKLTESFDFDNSYEYTKMLRDQINEKNDSWAIRWYASAFLKDKFTLYPGKSLVSNIGMDSSGTHCGTSNTFETDVSSKPVLVKNIPIKEDNRARNAIVEYYRTLRPSFIHRVVNRVVHIIREAVVNNFFRPLYMEPIQHVYKAIFDSEYRLYWMLEYRLRKTPRFKECSTTVHGLKLLIPDSASFLSGYKAIFVDRIYEFKFEGEEPKILDLGANIGLSVLFLKKMYPKAQITAFEADPQIFGYLTKNVYGNGYTDVELINKAAWHENKIIPFCSEGADGGRVAFASDESCMKISAININEFLHGRQFDFLKMDIEGAEEFVLPVCREHLDMFRYVFVEYHSKVGRKQCLDRIIGILSDAGFRINLHSGFCSQSPFVEVRTNAGFDLMVNIFAWKE